MVLPHLVRRVVGATHARLLTVAPLAGAVFMVWVDLVSRTLAAPRELPLGVITALVGVPAFITLMRRNGYVFGSRPEVVIVLDYGDQPAKKNRPVNAPSRGPGGRSVPGSRPPTWRTGHRCAP
ncbi:iron chelate uptake ABC transporter family permease subunit [Streptomyces sp. NPDC102360]|uniref:iron chelate uptake ABC transporter family permease subunit n=1 Tax=Streptomyces sp. NPDC102360 TaxID=3366160 RepID=UPI0037F4D18F